MRAPTEYHVTAVGLDLSLTGSGIAVIRRPVSPAGDTRHDLRKVGMEGVTNMSVAEQIVAIRDLAGRIDEATDLRARDGKVVVAIEGLDNAYSYGGSTERAVLWWRVVERLVSAGVDLIYMPTSAQVKIYATGNGQSKKPEVIEAVNRQWPWWQPGKDDNLADAAAMAELALAKAGEPSADLPVTHHRVLPRIRRITDPPARVAKRQAASDTETRSGGAAPTITVPVCLQTPTGRVIHDGAMETGR